MSDQGLVVVAVTKAKAGQEHQLRERLLSLLLPSRAEPGSWEFRLHQGRDDRSLLMSYEVWSGPEALQAHLQQPYMQAFLKEAPGLLAQLSPQELAGLGIASNPDITRWRRIGPERGPRAARCPLVILGRIRAKAGRQDQLKPELLDVLEPTRREPGCLRFELQQQVDDPTRFLAYQWWTSGEEDQAHYDHPYMQEFSRKSAGLLEGNPIILAWEEIEAKGNGMSTHDDTIIKALHEIAQAIHHGHKPHGPASWVDVPQDAFGAPGHEEVLVRYTVGTGRFSKDQRYSALDSKMYTMDKKPDGTFQGVWEPVLAVPPNDWFDRPTFDPPLGDFTNPIGPCPPVWPRAFTRAKWTFGDGSSVTGVGPAFLHLVPLSSGEAIFLVSVAGVITNGTGRYENAYGVKTALGATYPAGPKMLEGGPFQAVTVETFRIIRHPGARPGGTRK